MKYPRSTPVHLIQHCLRRIGLILVWVSRPTSKRDT